MEDAWNPDSVTLVTEPELSYVRRKVGEVVP